MKDEQKTFFQTKTGKNGQQIVVNLIAAQMHLTFLLVLTTVPQAQQH